MTTTSTFAGTVAAAGLAPLAGTASGGDSRPNNARHRPAAAKEQQ
jgi:hypothetical protein